MSKQMLELADEIAYGLATEGKHTLFRESGEVVVAALRLSAVSEQASHAEFLAGRIRNAHTLLEHDEDHKAMVILAETWLEHRAKYTRPAPSASVREALTEIKHLSAAHVDQKDAIEWLRSIHGIAERALDLDADLPTVPQTTSIESGASHDPCCPFCGRDPFHYVDNGVGMEAVAVTCCELGDDFFRGQRSDPETVTMSWDDFRNIGHRLAEHRCQVACAPRELDTEAIHQAIYRRVYNSVKYILGEQHLTGTIWLATQQAAEDVVSLSRPQCGGGK